MRGIENALVIEAGLAAEIVDAAFDLRAEGADQALHRPRGGVAKRADGVAFDLFGDFQEHVDLALVGAALDHAVEHPPHPAGAFAARRALAAALMLEEVADARDRRDHVGRLVHHDDAGGAERRLHGTGAVEIHDQVFAIRRRDQRARGTAGNDRQQIVPAAADAAAVLLDQLAERDAHGVFHDAGRVDVAGDAVKLGADIVGAADAGEPAGAATQDVRRHRDRLDVVHGGRAAIQADIGRERRLQARLALLAFQAFEQRGFLAADIGASAVGDIELEREAVDVVLADQSRRIGLVDRRLQVLALADEFTADIDVADMGAHRAAGNQAAFNQEMRIVPHDLAILAGAGLGLVGVDDEIARATVGILLRHERPFHAGREARPAAAAQAGRLHFGNDPVAALVENGLGAIPRAALARAVEAPVLEAVEITEDAVLVVEHGFLDQRLDCL